MESRLHRLDVQSDSHFISDENAARFQCGIPGLTKVLAIDFRGRR